MILLFNEAFQIVIKIRGHNTELVMVNFLYRDSLDLAFKYFTSSTLTVRLAGLSQITVSNSSFEEVVHVTCRYTVTCYMHATVPQTKCTLVSPSEWRNRLGFPLGFLNLNQKRHHAI